MAVKPCQLSVVIPAFNEQERLPGYLEAVRDYLARTFPDCHEILVVDDGSRDETSAVAAQILGPHSVIRLAQNMGKGGAVRAGMTAAKGHFQLFADADGATPIAEEQRLRQALMAGADIAIG